MKVLIIAITILGASACTQGDMEEIGEKADVAAEQANTGTVDHGQGPMEEMGEQHDKLD